MEILKSRSKCVKDGSEERRLRWIFTMDPVERLWQIFAAEFVGSTFLMFFGCMGEFYNFSGRAIPMQGGLVFGFVVSSIVVIFGHISKAHLNPAVTVCSLLLKMITPCAAFIYFIAEIFGSIAGIALLKAVTPCDLWVKASNASGGAFCNTMPHAMLSTPQTFMVEFMATCFLIFMVCSVWDPRNAANTDATAIKFALLISAVSIAVGPYTGASLNPSRSFAPAIMNNMWKLHWIYWIAPLSASVFSTLTYKYVFLEETRKQQIKSPNFDKLVKLPAKNVPIPINETSEEGRNIY